uniref:SFRICE_019270 n=1 Tax=Spodoptera frugiperda TaxID=7108 RepID=A0A2H1WPT2_SPOFR
MYQHAQVDIIYTDYSKCFDRIDHLLLAGIHGDLYRWFCSYVENRTQAVVLQGYTPGWTSVPSGVPQGSILGPLLFILFISDIKYCFKHSYILLYADDMKILKII